ncbi:MAG TPA: TetR family transcriptional regulator [Acidimicrobiales bacterium]|jgi:AcrR family transcriptional regulator|nr:TetR family transcriptional regulator [Acidimicrobiales bacterium]
MAPGPNVREKKQAERRGRVIEAAMVLASEGGYEAVHMRDVSAKADVAMGTIYRYFSSKDELLAAGLVTWIKLLRRRLSERPPRGSTPAERLADTLSVATRFSDRAAPLMKALITAMSSTDPAVAPHKVEVERLMSEIIFNGMGEVPDDVDVEGVRRVIGHVWSSAINRWVGGMAPNGSVAEELRNAAHLLLSRS